jgi:hypothetical protein
MSLDPSRILFRAVVLGAVAVLAACATTTPYQPLGDGGGFTEQKIETNRYRIAFLGNSSTPRQTVENYMLYRSAELTLNSGFDYFILTSNDTEARTRYSQSVSAYGGPAWGGWGWGGYRRGIGFGVSSATPITDYQAQAIVLMFKGQKPEQNPDAYDARAVKESLQPLIQWPQLQAK